MYLRGIFFYGTRRNAAQEMFSEGRKRERRPVTFFRGIDTTTLRPNFGSLCVLKRFSKKKISLRVWKEMDRREVVFEIVDWIYLAQDRDR
jgi:hypothetical protein